MKKSLNLIPRKRKTTGHIKRSLLVWASALIVGAFGIGSHLISLNRNAIAQQEKVFAAEQEFKHFRTMQTNIEHLRERVDFINLLAMTSERIAAPQPALTLLATISQAASKTSNLSVRKMDLKRLPSDDPEQVHDGFELVLTGVAENNLEVAKFAANLGKSGRFLQVELKSTKETVLAGKPVQAYELECSY